MSETMPGEGGAGEGGAEEGGTQWGIILTLAGVGVAVIGFLIYCICNTNTKDKFQDA